MNRLELKGRIVSDIKSGTHYKKRTDTKKSKWASFVLLVKTTKHRVDTFAIACFDENANKLIKYGEPGARVIVEAHLHSNKIFDYGLQKNIYVNKVMAYNVDLIDYRQDELTKKIYDENFRIKEKVINGDFPNVGDFKEKNYIGNNVTID